MRCRFRVIALLKFVPTSCDEECLLGMEDAFFDRDAHFFSQFGGRVLKVVRNALLNHKVFFKEWHQRGTTMHSMWYRSKRMKRK
jgi:hypothetical protein